MSLFQLFWLYAICDLISVGGIPVTIDQIKEALVWDGTINIVTIGLIAVTFIYILQVRKETEIVAKQADVMYKNQKIERITKEMDQLVAPLYSWIRENDLDGTQERIEILQIEQLQRNKYLVPKDLRSNIDDYILSRNPWNVSNTITPECVQALRNLEAGVKKRYDELEEEINKLEIELKIK